FRFLAAALSFERADARLELGHASAERSVPTGRSLLGEEVAEPRRDREAVLLGVLSDPRADLLGHDGLREKTLRFGLRAQGTFSQSVYPSSSFFISSLRASISMRSRAISWAICVARRSRGDGCWPVGSYARSQPVFVMRCPDSRLSRPSTGSWGSSHARRAWTLMPSSSCISFFAKRDRTASANFSMSAARRNTV